MVKFKVRHLKGRGHIISERILLSQILQITLLKGLGTKIKQAGMSCAQPQAEAVSLEQIASFLLKTYT